MTDSPAGLFLILQIITYVFVLLLAGFCLMIVVLYFLDRFQTTHAIRRNFPVIGRLRYFFEYLGKFFRQYFIAMDREELPFNRAERSWVYQAAKNIDSTIAFGSTRDLSKPGTVYFTNCMYPTLSIDAKRAKSITLGEDTRYPYTPNSYFHISAMSFGAISIPAVRALSQGAKQAGIWLNTGEGGLSPFHLEAGCDLVFQIGTGLFGVRDQDGNLCEQKLKEIASHDVIKMFEIKLSQGAKPGKGGILPGKKVTAVVAKIRAIPVGEDAISPNRFENISGPAELLDMIAKIRTATEKPTGIKLCVGGQNEIDDICREIVKRGADAAPDFITIDSGDGGSGAAPMSLADNVGMPIRESLPLVIDKLNEYNLRSRIRVIASGKLVTATEVAWAICTGADFINNARGFMFALGCIQALQCNKNTCPTGVTTHDEKLQAGLNVPNKAIRVTNYAINLKKEVGIIAHSCGVEEPRLLRRHHARIVTNEGKSISFSDLYPDVT